MRVSRPLLRCHRTMCARPVAPGRPYSAAGQAPSGAADRAGRTRLGVARRRSEEHTSELQSLMRISYAVFCLKKKKKQKKHSIKKNKLINNTNSTAIQSKTTNTTHDN